MSDFFVKMDSNKSGILIALDEWDNERLDGKRGVLPLCHGEKLATFKRDGFPIFRHDVDGISGGYVVVGPLSKRRASALAKQTDGKVIRTTRGIQPQAIGFHTDG